MDATEIIRKLAAAERMPAEAIEAARANREAVLPAFVRLVEQFVAGEEAPEDTDALFFIFHLLGEWREKSAYRPLAALLRLPTYDIENVLGDANTSTCHRVMAAVFDGDPAPLYEIIRDPDADEFVRARMCEALAMVTLRGELPREETARFLRMCFSGLEPQELCFVWDGWQSAIAMLGLVELVPLVKQAFEREFIDPQLFRFEEFEADLQQALAGVPTDRGAAGEFELFGDTIEELAGWTYQDPDDDEYDDDLYENESEGGEAEERASDEHVLWSASEGPAVNPYKGVGRNDPCPCGSGKKFKKCCLGKIDALSPAGGSQARPLSDVVAALRQSFPEEDVSDPTGPEYDPLVAPDPDDWRALDEEERIDAVMAFHRRARIRLPNAKVHATAHVIVENQVAEGDALPVRRTLARLMGEGLDRHDALHAIGMVLMVHMHDLMKAGDVEGDPNLKYYAELERLTAEEWRRSG